MYSKKDLLNQLEALNIDREGTLLVHSSYKSMGDIEGGPATVLDALSEFMKNGLLVLPTHTWEYINKDNPVFDVKESPSNVGVLTELFRKREGVVRSEHPTHSVAALGKEAKSFTEGEYQFSTACARESVWGKLVDRQAQILMLGVDLTKCTFIHGIEEWMEVPNRLSETPETLYSILHTGKKVEIPTYRHSGPDWSERFWKVDEILDEEGAQIKGQLGDAMVRLVDAAQTNDVLSELLQKNPELFTEDKPLEDKWRYYFRNKKSNEGNQHETDD
ncbi:AAC(3) family N-acetyltransferase [Alkalibacterium sp.]|nr:MAG: aminoglycoside N(3)-acetyltransferase [Alkalibacterium sp.]